MGVRPPQQGDDSEPDTIAFGIAALDEHLERADLRFPTAEAELLAAIGDREIPYDAKGNTLQLSEAIEASPRQRFETRQELMNALHPVFEARREKANNSIVGQLRSLFPF
jgi:hypothetical protein